MVVESLIPTWESWWKRTKLKRISLQMAQSMSLCSTKRTRNMKIGASLIRTLTWRMAFPTPKSSFQPTIIQECSIWWRSSLQRRSISCVQAPQVQVNPSIARHCSFLVFQLNISTFQSLSLPKPQQIRPKIPSIPSLRSVERVSMVPLQARNVSFLWMTWTCQRRRLMELNLPLSFWDSTLIMLVGMIERNLSSRSLRIWLFWQLWDLQVVVEPTSQTESQDTLICCHTLI